MVAPTTLHVSSTPAQRVREILEVASNALQRIEVRPSQRSHADIGSVFDLIRSTAADMVEQGIVLSPMLGLFDARENRYLRSQDIERSAMEDKERLIAEAAQVIIALDDHETKRAQIYAKKFAWEYALLVEVAQGFWKNLEDDCQIALQELTSLSNQLFMLISETLFEIAE